MCLLKCVKSLSEFYGSTLKLRIALKCRQNMGTNRKLRNYSEKLVIYLYLTCNDCDSQTGNKYINKVLFSNINYF